LYLATASLGLCIMRNGPAVLTSLALFTVGVLACGSGDAAATKETIASGSSQGTSARVQPCKLLTDAQVRTVVPDLQGSFVAASGESLTKGVESYQCSYVNPAAQGLLVILTVAADDEHVKQIRGAVGSYADAEKLDIGDAAWLFVRDENLNVTVHKQRTVIELKLNTDRAKQQSKALTELARAVAAKL
jgi:hypothetical protein